MSKAIYADSDDFQLWYEVINNCLFVHVHIRSFNKAVLADLREKWEALVFDAFFDGWEEIFTYTKDSRIVELIGSAKEVKDRRLARTGYRMFKWELK